MTLRFRVKKVIAYTIIIPCAFLLGEAATLCLSLKAAGKAFAWNFGGLAERKAGLQKMRRYVREYEEKSR